MCFTTVTILTYLELVGSGKSYLAKALRDLEVENGGNAPRIHSMDDYFMIEVEKVSRNWTQFILYSGTLVCQPKLCSLHCCFLLWVICLLTAIWLYCSQKVEDSEGSKSSSASKGRKQLTKKVIEYCYEPEMEEVIQFFVLVDYFRSLMLNALANYWNPVMSTVACPVAIYETRKSIHYCIAEAMQTLAKAHTSCYLKSGYQGTLSRIYNTEHCYI